MPDIMIWRQRTVKLLGEWDYEQNKLKPTEVSMNFSKESVVEMQARSFMEYEDK
ncbi:hypothetical protein [[Ruminococcus] lactaris]|uniref:hypothetical protein n=1 Tax=[Ruminococcus] lactaris TaxID=46228 RepID=UPI00242B18C6|nr:hypothetical protein [[Ruminococcus] lactaris]